MLVFLALNGIELAYEQVELSGIILQENVTRLVYYDGFCSTK